MDVYEDRFGWGVLYKFNFGVIVIHYYFFFLVDTFIFYVGVECVVELGVNERGRGVVGGIGCVVCLG